MPVIALTDGRDARLALYRGVSDPELLTRHGVFLAEGRLVVERLLASQDHEVRSVLLNAAAWGALRAGLEPRLDTLTVFVAPGEVFRDLTGHHVHRGALALVARPPLPALDAWLSSLLAGHGGAGRARAATSVRILAAEGVSNPDNVGGLFRNAAAFGASGVLLDPATTDPFYRKAVRTSVGATLTVPWTRATTWPDALASCRDAGFAVLALTTDPDAECLRTAATHLQTTPAVLLVGNEGHGLSQAALAQSTHRIRIPMAPGWDSLNAAVAAGIALYELSARP